MFTVIIGAKATGDEPYEYAYADGANSYGPFTRAEAYEFAGKAEKYLATCSPAEFVYGEPYVVVTPLLGWSADPVTSVDYWRLDPEVA